MTNFIIFIKFKNKNTNNTKKKFFQQLKIQIFGKKKNTTTAITALTLNLDRSFFPEFKRES